ncbi:unnamed protein product [Prunus brigantina]
MPSASALSLSRASLSLSPLVRDRHHSRPRFGRPFAIPATKVDGAGTEMTGPPSSSFPSRVPPPAALVSPENAEKSFGFDRNFAGFVLRHPAVIFGDQDMIMWAGENVAMPSVEVARVVGVAGVLTDPIRGRVREIYVIVLRSHVSGDMIMWAGENVARPSVEVARVVGVAGVLTDPIRGRVRPVARVVGVAGVLTDPVRGRVRPDVWENYMIVCGLVRM